MSMWWLRIQWFQGSTQESCSRRAQPECRQGRANNRTPERWCLPGSACETTLRNPQAMQATDWNSSGMRWSKNVKECQCRACIQSHSKSPVLASYPSNHMWLHQQGICESAKTAGFEFFLHQRVQETDLSSGWLGWTSNQRLQTSTR